MDKDRKLWKKKLNYKFDNFIAKGFSAQFFLLFIAILVIVVFFGIIAGLVSQQFGVGGGVWQSLTHILDQGTIGGDETDNIAYVTVMLIVTFLGMAFTGTIVGIINNAMSDKLDSLKKGHSQIMEEKHVVIIGFDENIHTILDEIEKSNENWLGNRTVVVIDDEDKEEMEFCVREHKKTVSFSEEDNNKKKKKTTVIFRSGDVVSDYTYSMASVEKARAIIINKQDDFDVIRAILALTTYLKKHNAYKNEKMPSIVSLMHNHENISAAAIASGVYHEKSELIPQEELQYELKIRNLFFEDILAHIFAQVCRQPGLSWVVSELFDYAASEIYIENVANGGQDVTELLTGKTFAEISRGVVNSIAIGIQRGTESFINPSSDMIFEKTDKLIHVAEDDNCLMIDFNRNVQLVGKEAKEQKKVIAPYHFLVLGWSSPLPDVIENISKYTRSGSTLTVISDHLALDEVEFTKYDNLDVKDTVKINPYEWNKVEKYFEEYKIWDKDNSQRPTNIIIMCQDDIDKVEADEKVAVLLLNIREFLKRKELDRVVNITTEMNLPEDQRLLSHTNAHDFIVGSEIANRMLVQVANDPDIYKVFTEILDAKGSELYMRNFAEYVDTDEPFNFNYVQEVVRQRANRGDGKQEIAIGWLRLGDSKRQTKACINPKPHIKNNIFRLEEGESFADYRLVVLAMDE